MVEIKETESFARSTQKVKDNLMKTQIKKQIIKIIQNPEIGKPMMYDRKGTREIYIKPFRISYCYLKNENKIIFLELYHKKKQ